MKDEPIERKWSIFLIGISKERSWKSRYDILDGREMKLPTIQGITASAAPELPSYRRDTPPSPDCGIRASEGDRGGSPELVYSRAVFFFLVR